MSKKPKLAVLGAGNTGTSLAGILALSGYNVSFGELSDFKENIKQIIEKGGIDVEGEFKVGFAELDCVSTNISEVIEDRNVIFYCSPAYGHEAFTKACAPHLEDEQTMVYISYFGALRMRKVLLEMNCNAKVTISETLNCIYVGDRVGPTKVLVKRRKESLPVAALPADETPRVLTNLNRVFRDLVPARNVLETSINNNNPIAHVPGVILNAGWIESTGGGFTSNEGRTHAVKQLERALDMEKMEIAGALELEKISNEEWTSRFYRKVIKQTGGSTMQPKYYSKSTPTPGAMAPANLKHRYLVEDIQYAFVPMASVANSIGVETPSMNAVIHIASILNATDYMQYGANIEKLGLAGLNKTEMNTFVG